MIKQSDLALAAWKATERTLDSVVTINKIDYKTTDIASISYDAGGYTGDTFGIGSNYENSVTIKFSHLIEGLKPGMTVLPKIGIKTSNGYEYSSLGLFIVSDDIQMDRNNDETTIKAYDQMCLLEGTYTSKLTYPAKMTSVIAEIANLAGVLLNTTDISHLPVQVNLPSAITGQTYRNAIGMIAQFYAGFATFDRDGKLTIRTIAESDYTLDPSQYEQGGLTKNEAPYKIGGIQCEVTTTTTDSTGQSTETTNRLQVGATSGSQIKLTNNLMTMDRLASIWQQLQSLTFYPFSLNWFGNPAIEAGDWLTLQDTKGNKFNVPNNGYTMTFDGSLSAVSKADQTSTSSSSYAWRGELSQYVADLGGRQGASGNYIYGTDTTEPPYGAKFNDIWYKQNGNKVELWTYERQTDGTGKWVLTVSDTTGEEVKAKVDQVELEAKAGIDTAKAAIDKAARLAAKYDDTNALANQAMDKAVGAQSDASSAAAKANSTASEFGKVDQKAESALASALGAQSDASVAVKQASSAAADSKDAKQIAGAVSQSYKTLTDGSTMTIAELQNGLAAKLTKTDLNGYATQTWTQNQIKMTADGINGTMSSIKSTVDGQTTSINDLKADSSSFKSQFTTVNNTLGKQTTDIGTLQATSKELTTGFNTLTTDNTTNKNNISQLQQTATELNSTMTTVQTQVQNSAVGTNLLTGTSGDLKTKQLTNMYNAGAQATNGDYKIKLVKGQTYTYRAWIDNTNGQTHAYVNARFLATTEYNLGNGTPIDKGEAGYSTLMIKPTEDGYVHLTPVAYSSPQTNLIGWKEEKLEKGSLSTDWCPNPADNATVTALSKLSQTVDGMKADISKKIEKKDLNGYATETWAQNQINISANGINGTISSVKSTVDGHTTSINNLQADSNGFKAQFTTVNNTIGKHTTDIGTLQASTKSLSASFDSLSTDNNTNKHDISQLQASATAFNSTLLTVQQQVIDSAVGTNLLLKTYNPFIMTGNGGVNQATLMYALSRRLEKETTVTLSFDAISTASANFTIQNSASGDGGTWMGYLNNAAVGTTKKHYVATIKLDGYSQQGAYLRLDNVPSTATITFSNMKLELGSNATDYSTNPLDNATVDAVSSISQTINSIQTTVSGKVDGSTYQSKMTQIDNAIITKVSKGDVTNENILPYSGYWSDTTGWNLASWGASDKALGLFKHSFYHNSADSTMYVRTAQNTTAPAASSRFTLIPNTTYTFSFWGFATGNVIGTNVYLLGRSYTSTDDYEFVHGLFEGLKMSPAGINKYTVTFKTNPNETQAYIRLDNIGSNDGQDATSFFAELKLEQGDTATPYTRVSSGEIQVTSDNINLKVSKDGVINAINVSNEGTQIYGNKLHITAATYIDNAVIKDAMIANLSADKLTAGTINAANINVINLNANNITTGTISGSNLSINLNTGNVQFQAGRIHSADNAIDININDKYISVADNTNRVFISGGEIQMIEPRFLSYQVTPYVRISNEGAGSSIGGATFWARDYFAITNKGNDFNMFSSKMGTESFSGIAGGHSTGGWEVTKVGGADRGVVISGGHQYSNGFISYSPYIRVGDDGKAGAGMGGSNIVMEGDYIYAKSQHTTSRGANAYLAPDGALVPSNSAAKYKTDIVRSFETGMGDKLLEVPVAHWKDKEEVLSKTLNPSAKTPETYFGMIADDLDDAGLNELVEYDDKGSVRGIQYDRVALALIPLIRNYRDRITELETEVKEMKEV